MFFDERINNLISKIFSKAILYATIISTVYLVIKTSVFGFIFSSSIPEIFIVITGIVILIIDTKKFKDKTYDERIVEDRMIFYKKGSNIFLGMSLLGFAIAIPIQFLQLQEVPPINHLFINLELLGFIFFSYQFKKQGIFFNYTFIEKESGYYKDVFLNILKLVILTSGVYGISLIISIFIFLIHSWMIVVIVGVIFAYIISTLTLSLTYLFISWMERLSYKSLLNRFKYLRSQIIIGIIYLIFNVIGFHLKYLISTFEPLNISNAGSILLSMIDLSNSVAMITQLLFVMLLTNILIQFKDNVKGIGILITTIIVLHVIRILTAYIHHLDFFNEPLNANMLSLITIYIYLVLGLIQVIGLFILTISLIRNKMSVMRIAIPIFSLVRIFLNLGFQKYSNENKLLFIVLEVIFGCFYIISLILIKNDDEVLLNS